MSALVAPEAYVDLCTTTVASGGYTAGSGVLNVASTGSPFPQVQQFHFYIADATTKAVKAVGLATAINSGTQWAVTMSTDANANQNDVVALSLCAGAMDQIRTDINQYGTRANLPSTTGQKTGNTYKCTDSPYSYIFNGSAWDAYVYGMKVTEPVSANFSWANQGSCSVSSTYGGEILTFVKGSSDSLRVRYLAAPSTPYTITALLVINMTPTSYNMAGLCFYNSSSGKLCTLCFQLGSSGYLELARQNWNTTTSFSATVTNTPIALAAGEVWLRITDDGTNFKFYASVDRVNWVLCETVSRTAFLTPQSVGYIADQTANLFDSTAWLLDWTQS